MSRKRRRRRKKVLPLPKGITDGIYFCGFRLNTKKLNLLWEWNVNEEERGKKEEAKF